MISVKDAVMRARDSYRELIGAEPDLLLEEVEKEDGFWKVTLSAPVKQEIPSIPETILNLNPLYKRTYKVFLVDADTGEVTSMKIRNVDAA